VTTRTTREVIFVTEVMTKVTASERSAPDTGETADGMSDAPKDIAMEMAMEVTSIAAETAVASLFELMAKNEK
jgi:hypothetical protein